MRAYNCCLHAVALVTLLSFIGCHKDNGPNPPAAPPSPPPPIDTLTQNIYTINAEGSSSPAIILCTPFDLAAPESQGTPGLLLIMDQDGKVLQKQTTGGTAFNLNRWIINGQTRYTWFVDDVHAFRAPGVIGYAGYEVIADSNLQTLKRVNFLPNGPDPFPAGQSLDAHDFILLSDDHYLTITYIVKHPDNIPAYINPSPNVRLQVPLIQEVNNGAVTWQWDGSSDTAFYANAVEGNNYADSVNTQDYMHINAMYLDPKDNNLICSFRNQDQVVKLSRQTGAVLWRLGGRNSDFPLFSDQRFLRQHNPTLTDSNKTLLLFDDGEITQRPESRVLEFRLDEQNKKVTGFKSFTIPEPFSQLMGSVQKSGEEYFIGGGTGNYMLEVNYVTGQKIREFLGVQTSYRAYSYPVAAKSKG
ncbi:MAG TPA: aryl-sulfate sulfotransferase [Puia sp.]|jgi:hypothetical protein